jgi:hypothetical protein
MKGREGGKSCEKDSDDEGDVGRMDVGGSRRRRAGLRQSFRDRSNKGANEETGDQASEPAAGLAATSGSLVPRAGANRDVAAGASAECASVGCRGGLLLGVDETEFDIPEVREKGMFRCSHQLEMSLSLVDEKMTQTSPA